MRKNITERGSLSAPKGGTVLGGAAVPAHLAPRRILRDDEGSWRGRMMETVASLPKLQPQFTRGIVAE